MTTATVVRKTYPTLVTVNGVTSELSLEELSLIAIERYVDTGTFEEIKQVSLMVPVTSKIIGTKEIFLEQYKNDFILVEANLATNNYLFGPINENTASLAMHEISNGAPVYRSTTFGDLNIINPEVLDILDRLKGVMPSYSGVFTIRHRVKSGSDKDRRVSVNIEEHTIASLLYVLRQASHKSLPYYDIFTSQGQRPATLATAMKNFTNDISGKDYTVDIVSAKSIKDLSNASLIVSVTGDSNRINDCLIANLEGLYGSVNKGEKLYVTNIREKECRISDFVSKRELHEVKQFFDKLPQRINSAVNSLTGMYN